MAYTIQVATAGRSAQKRSLRNVCARSLLLIATFLACLKYQVHPLMDRDSGATTFVWRCSPSLDLLAAHSSLPRVAARRSTSRLKGRSQVVLPMSATSEDFEATASMSTELRLRHVASMDESVFVDVAEKLGTLPTIDERSKEAIEHICNEELKFPGGCELRIVGLQSNFTAIHLSSDVDIGIHTPDHVVTLDERNTFLGHLAKFDLKVIGVAGAAVNVATLDNVERAIVFLNQDFDDSSKNDYHPMLARQLHVFFESNEPAQGAVRMLKYAFFKSERLPPYVLEYFVLVLRNARLGMSELALFRSALAQIQINSKFFEQALMDATLANKEIPGYKDYLFSRAAAMRDLVNRALMQGNVQ